MRAHAPNLPADTAARTAAHGKASILAAMAAVLALGFGADAQLTLERVRLLPAPPRAWAALLFLIGATFAVTATWRRDAVEVGSCPLRIAPVRWPWLAACA